MAANFPTTIYQEVRAWLAHQEAYEAEHKQPAPLSEAQRLALLVLCPPAQAPPPAPLASTPATKPVPVSESAPSLVPAPVPAAPTPLFNYVGLLQETLQKIDPSSQIAWSEEADGVLAGGTTGRICRVTISESQVHPSGHIDSFPAAGYGLSPQGVAPRFKSKKEAKHFAAKCATDWLAAQGLSSPPPPWPASTTAASSSSLSLLSSSSPPPPPPLSSREAASSSVKVVSSPVVVVPAPPPASLKRATQSENPPPAKRQSTTTARSSPNELDDGGGGGGGAAIDDAQASVPVVASAANGLPATALVSQLCNDLGFTAPRYKITESVHGGGRYDGRAEFADPTDLDQLALSQASVVNGALGKSGVKQAVAANVLRKLREIDAERSAQIESLERVRDDQI